MLSDCVTPLESAKSLWALKFLDDKFMKLLNTSVSFWKKWVMRRFCPFWTCGVFYCWDLKILCIFCITFKNNSWSFFPLSLVCGFSLLSLEDIVREHISNFHEVLLLFTSHTTLLVVYNSYSMLPRCFQCHRRVLWFFVLHLVLWSILINFSKDGIILFLHIDVWLI